MPKKRYKPRHGQWPESQANTKAVATKVSKFKGNLKTRYNVSPEYYFRLLKEQKKQCAICGKKGKLLLDHCHTSKEVRAFLCLKCNSAIGYLGESVDTLLNAIRYLTKFGK